MIATQLQTRRSRRIRRSRILVNGLRVLRDLRVLRVCFVVRVLGVPVRAQTLPDRTRPPALAPTPQLDLPAIQKRALSNGLAVWLVESHEVPIVQVNVVVRAGAGDDPAGKFGTASLTAAMLDEGAGSRSALEIADAVEFLGASLTTTSSFDSSAVRLNVPVERLRDAPVRAGRRDTAAHVPRHGAGTTAAGAADRAAAGARRPRLDRADGIRAHRFRRDAPVRHRRRRYRGHAEGLFDRRPRRISCRLLPAGQCRPRRRRRHHACRGPPGAGKAVRRLEGIRRAGAPRACPRGAAGGSRRHLHRRQARGRAVADPDRVGWRTALDAGLLPADRPEHDPGRIVHVAPEPEPPGRARLRVRRGLFVRHAAVGRALRRGGRRPDRQDRRIGTGVLQRADEALRPNRSARTRLPRRRTTSRSAFLPSSNRRPISRDSSRSSSFISCRTTISNATSPTCRRSRPTRCRRWRKPTFSRRVSPSWSSATARSSSRASARSTSGRSR